MRVNPRTTASRPHTKHRLWKGRLFEDTESEADDEGPELGRREERHMAGVGIEPVEP